MDCKKMWIIRTLLMLLALSAHTYAFYIKTDDVELQQEPSDLENTNEYNNYAPQPRSLGLMETYEKLRNYLTSPWKKETNSSIITPENMQNVSQYENMQQNELSFDPYHLTKPNISRSDPVDYHAPEFLPILTEKYLKINLTAGQKISEENDEDVKDNWRMDDSRFELKNDAINEMFSNASESDHVVSTRQEDDEDEPMDLLRSLSPSDYAEDLVEGQENKNLTENAENIADTSIDKDNIIEITNEESNNDIAGDINQTTTENAVELVENMIEDSEDQFLTSQVQVISTTMIPGVETTPYINLDFIQSNINTEENYMNADQVENFKRETQQKSKKSKILSDDDDDLVVIEGNPVNIRQHTNDITEAPALFNENYDSLIIQDRSLSIDEITTQIPEEETTSAQLNDVDTIPNRNEDINILSDVINPSSDTSTATLPIVTNPVLEDRNNLDLHQNIFTSTPSTFEENTSEVEPTPSEIERAHRTPEIDQIESITENKFQLRMTYPGVIDDLILLVPRPSNATENQNIITETPEPCNYNDDSLIIVGRSLNCVEGKTMSTEVNGVDVVPEIETESNILHKINPSSDIFSGTNEDLENTSTIDLSINSDRELKDHTSSDLKESVFTTTISMIEESNSEIVRYDEILHDQISQNITEVNEIAETTTQIDQTENIRSVENLNDLENANNTENDSFITHSHNSETISQPELTPIKIENDTEDSSEYFTNLLGTYTDFDAASNVNTKDIIQIDQLSETSTITALAYNDEDLASPILADPFNVFEISEELVKPRSILDESVDNLNNLDINEQDSFTNQNIEVTSSNTGDTDTSTHIDNQYMNSHHQNDEFTTEFLADHQTVIRELFTINPSTELNKNIDLTTGKYLEDFEKFENIPNHDQVIYTTMLPDTTIININNHNNYKPTMLSNEQDQSKSVADSENGRSFDFSVNLIEIPEVISTTNQHEDEHQFDLTTEEAKTIETLIAANSDQFTKNIVTIPPFSYIETDEPSVLEVEEKTFSSVTEINFKTNEKDSMRISDQSLELNKDVVLTTGKYLENIANQNRVIYTTMVPDSTTIDINNHNNYEPTILPNEQDQFKSVADIENERSFDFSVNLIEFPIVTPTAQHEEKHQIDLTTEEAKTIETLIAANSFLTTEEPKTIDTLIAANSDQFTQNNATAPPLGHIETDEPSVLEVDDKIYSPATEINFRSNEEDLMRIGDQSSDVVKLPENIFTTELPNPEIVDTKYQNNEFSTASNKLEHQEDISESRQFLNSVFEEESITDGKTDPSNDLTTVDHISLTATTFSDNLNTLQKVDLVTEDPKGLEITTRDSFEHAAPIFTENQTFNSPPTVSVINESNESNQTGESSLEVTSAHSESTEDSDSTSVEIHDLSDDLATKFVTIKNEDSKSDESNEHGEKSTDGEDQQEDSASNDDSLIEISPQSHDLASKSTDSKKSNENSESTKSNEYGETPTDSEDQQNNSISSEDSSIDSSPSSHDLPSNSIDSKTNSGSSESDESNEHAEKPTDAEDQQNDSVSNEDSPIDIGARSHDLASKSIDSKNSSENSESDESNEHDEKSANGEDQQKDSVSTEDSSIDINAKPRDLPSKSTDSKNNSENSESDESNEYKEDSNQSELSEETSSSIETSNQASDNKSDYSASESIENEEKPSNEESVQSGSIEDDSSSVETNNRNYSENSVSNESDEENKSKSKTLNAEKRTDSASNEKDSSIVEIDDNVTTTTTTTTKAVTSNFDHEVNEVNDSNQAGERTSEEFHHYEKKLQSTSSEEDISSIENSDQSEEEDREDHSFKSKKRFDDSSEESLEEIIPFPIQRVPQGRSFSFDESNNRNDYGQQPDKKSPPFTKVVFSDPLEGENDNQSIVLDKEIDNDSNTKRGMDDENSPDTDDVSTAVVETLIEAAELTTEFTRHISSFRSSTEASSTISDTADETSTTSLPPDMDESDREQLNAQVNSMPASAAGMSKLTIVILIGLAIFAIVATIAAVLIFKYHKRRETFDIQLEERHEKKDSNTTQSTTNGVE